MKRNTIVIGVVLVLVLFLLAKKPTPLLATSGITGAGTAPNPVAKAATQGLSFFAGLGKIFSGGASRPTPGASRSGVNSPSSGGYQPPTASAVDSDGNPLYQDAGGYYYDANGNYVDAGEAGVIGPDGQYISNRDEFGFSTDTTIAGNAGSGIGFDGGDVSDDGDSFDDYGEFFG